MARKKFSCDFETTTKIDDCRVWAYGWMEIGKKTNFKIGNSLDEFMQWCEKSKADLYFHNLRFDGEFIVNWLLRNGWQWSDTGQVGTFSTTISSMGQWYMIDICYGYRGKKKLHTCIYDSLKKLPFSVKTIAESFKLPIMKGEIDYHAERPIGHEITAEEFDYIKNDIEIIADALQIQFKQGLEAMTSGSDSLKGFKDSISKKKFDSLFPVLSKEIDDDLRLAYKGGFTWLNKKYKNKSVGQGLVYDVNSLYPSQMYDRDLPYGLPMSFKGEYVHDDEFPLFVQKVRCEFHIKPDKIPMIQIKKNPSFKENEYLENNGDDPVDLYVTNMDWELILEHYDVYDVEFLGGWKFKKLNGIFKDFIDKWTYIKTTQEGAIKQLAKLMLNSLYGKFATNPDVTGKVPYLKEDGSCGFRMGDEEFKDPVYTAMGIFITSWARYTTITTAQKCHDRIIYCDTDSIHLVGTDVPDAIKDVIDDKRLGYWQHESTFKKAKYIRQKTYAQDIYKKRIEKNGKSVLVDCGADEATETKFSVKCAGMPERCKENVTFENFEIGFSSGGKLAPKHVAGGVVLVDTVYTLNA